MGKSAGQAPEPGHLLTAVADPDRRVALSAIRDRLAAELIVAEGAAVASLAKQLVEVVRVLDEMTPPEVSALDQLADRRAARRAEVQDPPAESGKRRARGGRASG